MNFTKKIIVNLRRNNFFPHEEFISIVKHLFLFISFFLFSIFLTAQDSIRVNAFLEIGGNAGITSINFDKPVIIFKKSFLSLRVGIGISQEVRINQKTQDYFFIPTMIHYSIGKAPHYFETGFGLSLGISTRGNIISRISPSLGYRFQKSESSGMFFRITYTPLLPSGFGDELKQWGGLSVGYTFQSRK